MKDSLGAGWQLLRHRGPSQMQFWLIALFIGVAAGLAAMLFRMGIEALQSAVYGTPNVNRLHSFAETLDWWWVLVIPVLGGMAVGLILYVFTPDGRLR